MWWAQDDEDVVALRRREKAVIREREHERRMLGLPPEDASAEGGRKARKKATSRGSGKLEPLGKWTGESAAQDLKPDGCTAVLDFGLLSIGFSMRLAALEARDLFGMLAPGLEGAVRSTRPVSTSMLSRIARMLQLPPEMGRKPPAHIVSASGSVSLTKSV